MIYFLSDTHLGLDNNKISPLEREKKLVKFLTDIEHNCSELFLVGDIFDFWFEWNKSIPKNFSRILGKLALMVDNGIIIHFFIGNHDLWIKDYLQNYIGLTVHTQPLIITRQGKKLFITHGDTLYKHKGFSRLIEIFFKSKTTRWIAQRIIHPDSMLRFGQKWSRSNRKKHDGQNHKFTEENDNWVIEARKILQQTPDINYFIFGHLHIPLTYELNINTKLIILGEWIDNPHYTTLDDAGEITLHKL
ncbi:MAG: UDP-2,3-diacylglucosamine diphosphatase [Rikenellaceae bacterium]